MNVQPRSLLTWSAALLMSLAFQCSADSQDNVALPERDQFRVFLLAGQSNMAGRGAVEPQDKQRHPRVLMFTKDNRWVPAADPLHFDKPAVVGVGLGKPFGIDIADTNLQHTIGLIPCAVGGSPIDSWKPGEFYKPTQSYPWDDAIRRAKVALEKGTLAGILWHQGESDCTAELAPAYEAKLHDLIARFRQELQSPEIPFIVGQMGLFAEKPWDEHKRLVDTAHRELPGKVAHTAFVSAQGLAHKGDEVHFDSPSYRELGHRYARAFLDLQMMSARQPWKLPFEVQRVVAHRGFDGVRCWVHPRAGVLPPNSPGNEGEHPTVVMTMQELELSGSDVFHELHELRTSDAGATWTKPSPQKFFARARLADGVEETVCDFTPKWHAASGKLLGTGHTVRYLNNQVQIERARDTAYAVYDPVQHSWSAWRRLTMPPEPRFENAGAGSVQRYDLENGDILLPIYFKVPREQQYSTTVVRCRFDGQELKYVEHGDEVTVPVIRGLYEPSLTRFGDRFYLTMRNDQHGYVSVGEDGLHYSKPVKWTFDDGADLGNYNTQQHWVSHERGLYLVYNRRGANNDHVMRHRAPLFVAQVDVNTLRVIRETEQILIPERGARMGNFAIAEVSPNEIWVTVAEWMQPAGIERYGSDNSIHVARILFR